MKKLALVTSHPIQYYAPLFRQLAKEIELKVFYCHNPNAEEVGKDGFGKAFEWDVDLLSGYEYEFLENQSKNPSLSAYGGCDTPQIGEALKKYGATHVVIFGWYLKSFKQALQYCKANKIPVAARGDSQLDPHMPVWKKIIKKLYYPFFLKQYDAFLSVGKRNKEYLMHFKVPENKIIFSPHAVDQEFWKVFPGHKDARPFTFVWVGKFIDLKQPEQVLKAFSDLRIDPGMIRLKMVGTGTLYEDLIEKFKRETNVEFLGFQNQTELLKIYNNSDCLILSSNSETWGLVVNEAMSCGIPAIVSDACGCSDDMIDEGKTGYVYPFANLAALKIFMMKAVEKRNFNYQPFLQEKNKIYSFERNMQSFMEFLEFSLKS